MSSARSPLQGHPWLNISGFNTSGHALNCFVMKQGQVMTTVEWVALFLSPNLFNPYLLSITSHYSVPLLSKNNATNVSSNAYYDL